jgi:hypothetical protein
MPVNALRHIGQDDFDSSARLQQSRQKQWPHADSDTHSTNSSLQIGHCSSSSDNGLACFAGGSQQLLLIAAADADRVRGRDMSNVYDG